MSFLNIDYVAQEGLTNGTPITINQKFKVTVSINGYIFCTNTFRLILTNPESPNIQALLPIEKIDWDESSSSETTQVFNLYSRNDNELDCGRQKDLTVDFRNENKNESLVFVRQTRRISFLL